MAPAAGTGDSAAFSEASVAAAALAAAPRASWDAAGKVHPMAMNFSRSCVRMTSRLAPVRGNTECLCAICFSRTSVVSADMLSRKSICVDVGGTVSELPERVRGAMMSDGKMICVLKLHCVCLEGTINAVCEMTHCDTSQSRCSCGSAIVRRAAM